MSFQEEKTYRTAAETLSEASLVFSRGKCAKIFKRVYFEARKKFASQKICKKRLHLNIWPIFLYEIHEMLAITPKCGKSESSFLPIYLPIPNGSVNPRRWVGPALPQNWKNRMRQIWGLTRDTQIYRLIKNRKIDSQKGRLWFSTLWSNGQHSMYFIEENRPNI